MRGFAVILAVLMSAAALGLQFARLPEHPLLRVVAQVSVPEVKVEPDVSVVAMPAVLDKDTVADLLKGLKIEAPNVTVTVPDPPAPIVNVAVPNCPRVPAYSPVRRPARWCPQ